MVLDAETSGFDPRQHRLLSLSAVRVQAGQIDLHDSFDGLFQNQYADDGRPAAVVHGILSRESLSGHREDNLLPEFLSYLGDSWIAGHFVGHDLTMLNQALQRLQAPPLHSPVLDTSVLYRRWRDGPLGGTDVSSDRSLDTICQDLDIPVHDRHTAAGDTFMTALVLLKLLYRLERRGVRTARDLRRIRR